MPSSSRAPRSAGTVVAGLVAVALVGVASYDAVTGAPDLAPPPAPVDAPPPAPVAPPPDAPPPRPRRVAPPPPDDDDVEPDTLEAQREELLARLGPELELTAAQMDAVRAIFAKSRRLGQGSPEANDRPMKRRECRAIRKEAGLEPTYSEACGAWNMVPVWNPRAGETEADARVCVDQLEFPDLPCEYPVVWVQASEAAELCEAVGKRLCDAHEWEGACAGAVLPADEEYLWGRERKLSKNIHNEKREIRWAYGSEKDHAKCATGSRKGDRCSEGSFRSCGSNHYPTGAFPKCVSPFGVYDQHGNAAEHMNLPTRPQELASRGGSGYTEMKGSWFIFSSYEAHPDDCRWRAPDWHATAVRSPDSHLNYHLGFRCCKDVEPRRALHAPE
jgi:hypothetical protein